MKSSASTVGQYVEQVAGLWQPVVARLRAACREHLDGYDEVMAYGMPTYQFDNQAVVAFAKQARYLSLYVMKEEVLDAHRQALRGLNVGKGCIRYERPDQIDWDLVDALLRDTSSSSDRPC